MQIDMIRRGAWEVKLSTKRTGLICGTLADAEDKARRSIGRRPYELIIRERVSPGARARAARSSCKYH